ncbi:uncharacterized protein BJ171DRAFT_496261 [Polychytrium aggregatum]|uniref:uncharacterized protein n=1 Tax=Polychytrium aggregatum TaxID=110093 RepID=UPI0022FE0D5E|nr:uncharacterized protein BJ171DRAFT_496261 [Polychytrium aggregatum]KAI9206576.1 hypothetical protein BJ171DRAFT_496261 [Polychytrium aggregatum]
MVQTVPTKRQHHHVYNSFQEALDQPRNEYRTLKTMLAADTQSIDWPPLLDALASFVAQIKPHEYPAFNPLFTQMAKHVETRLLPEPLVRQHHPLFLTMASAKHSLQMHTEARDFAASLISIRLISHPAFCAFLMERTEPCTTIAEIEDHVEPLFPGKDLLEPETDVNPDDRLAAIRTLALDLAEYLQLLAKIMDDHQAPRIALHLYSVAIVLIERLTATVVVDGLPNTDPLFAKIRLLLKRLYWEAMQLASNVNEVGMGVEYGRCLNEIFDYEVGIDTDHPLETGSETAVWARTSSGPSSAIPVRQSSLAAPLSLAPGPSVGDAAARPSAQSLIDSTRANEHGSLSSPSRFGSGHTAPLNSSTGIVSTGPIAIAASQPTDTADPTAAEIAAEFTNDFLLESPSERAATPQGAALDSGLPIVATKVATKVANGTGLTVPASTASIGAAAATANASAKTLPAQGELGTEADQTDPSKAESTIAISFASMTVADSKSLENEARIDEILAGGATAARTSTGTSAEDNQAPSPTAKATLQERSIDDIEWQTEALQVYGRFLFKADEPIEAFKQYYKSLVILRTAATNQRPPSSRLLKTSHFYIAATLETLGRYREAMHFTLGAVGAMKSMHSFGIIESETDTQIMLLSGMLSYRCALEISAAPDPPLQVIQGFLDDSVGSLQLALKLAPAEMAYPCSRKVIALQLAVVLGDGADAYNARKVLHEHGLTRTLLGEIMALRTNAKTIAGGSYSLEAYRIVICTLAALQHLQTLAPTRETHRKSSIVGSILTAVGL